MAITMIASACPAKPTSLVSIAGAVPNVAVLSFSDPVIVTGKINLHLSGGVQQLSQVQVSSTCVCITCNATLLNQTWSYTSSTTIQGLIEGAATSLVSVSSASGTFSTQYDPPHNGIMAFDFWGQRMTFCPQSTWCVNGNATGYEVYGVGVAPANQCYFADPLGDLIAFLAVNYTVNGGPPTYTWPAPFHIGGDTDVCVNPQLALQPFIDFDGTSAWELTPNCGTEFALNYGSFPGGLTQSMILDANGNPIGSSNWHDVNGLKLFSSVGPCPTVPSSIGPYPFSDISLGPYPVRA